MYRRPLVLVVLPVDPRLVKPCKGFPRRLEDLVVARVQQLHVGAQLVAELVELLLIPSKLLRGAGM